VTGVTCGDVTWSTVLSPPGLDDGHGFSIRIRCPEPLGPGDTGEVNQVADKKIAPKAASSTKTSSTDAAARVEKKSLKRHKKTKKKGK
jgi:hypothetical protein